MALNFRQIKAIENKNKGIIKSQNPSVSEASGIYILYRTENDFKFAYVGQAKHLLTRLAQHLRGYQHIDLSIKKHGFYDENTNPSGYKIYCQEYPESELNEQEQYFIKCLANQGYQLRNKTSGSQGEGKKDIADEPTKGYLQGLHNGYEKARKEVAHLFNLHLDFVVKGNSNKIKEKAYIKFENFLKGEEYGNN